MPNKKFAGAAEVGFVNPGDLLPASGHASGPSQPHHEVSGLHHVALAHAVDHRCPERCAAGLGQFLFPQGGLPALPHVYAEACADLASGLSRGRRRRSRACRCWN